MDAFLSFWGLAFTIVCGAVGCFKLPPAFSNSWRLGIFVGLLVCYVIGYFNGMKKKSLERDTGRESEIIHKARLEDEKERHRADLERLSKAEEENTKLRNLLDAQKTLTSSYEKKYAELSARIDNEEKAAEDNQRVDRLKNDARSLSAENKLLLLYLSDNGSLDVAIDDFKLQEFLDDAMPLVTITNMGWQWYSLELSDKGTTMVEVARDILEKADPYRAHIWWYENADQTWEPKE